MFLLFITGYTKLLVGIGYTNIQFSDEVEVIDLASEETSCQILPKFPLRIEGGFGGLDFQDDPIIWGGRQPEHSDECYSYKNNKWTRSYTLLEPRFVFNNAIDEMKEP